MKKSAFIGPLAALLLSGDISPLIISDGSVNKRAMLPNDDQKSEKESLKDVILDTHFYVVGTHQHLFGEHQSLFSIADTLYGVPHFGYVLAKMNNIDHPYVIHPYDMLRVEQLGIHTVQKGETLESIAEKVLGSRSEWRDLYELNVFFIDADPKNLAEGTSLAYRLKDSQIKPQTIKNNTPRIGRGVWIEKV